MCARDAYVNAWLSFEQRNSMTRPMGMLSGVLSSSFFLVVDAIVGIALRCDIAAGAAFVVHLGCNVRAGAEVCTRWIEFFFNFYVATYLGSIQKGFLRGFQKS